MDEAEQRRSAAVLPGQADKPESRNGGLPAPVPKPAVAAEHGCIDPGVVRSEPSSPDDTVDVDPGAVAELGSTALGRDEPRAEIGAEGAQLTTARADDQIAAGTHPAGQCRVGRLVDQPEPGQPPEEVP